MNFFQKFFSKVKTVTKYFRFKELGSYVARFTPFGREIYASDIVRSCIRPLAEHTARSNPRSSDVRIEQLLNYSPNIFMSGHDFLAKCRNILEVKNTLFVLIQRDNKGHAIAYYPVPYQAYEAVEYGNGIFIKFNFNSDAMRELIAPWEDLCVLRKDYLFSDIGGEDNGALLPKLGLVQTTNEGLANAIKATANLRGILKNTKTMLDDGDVKKSRDQFVEDYLSLENSGGIAALDPTQEFIPIKMEPAIASYTQIKEFREDVYRYFGVSEDIVMSKASEAEMETFYTSRIEPFLVAFSLELTRKTFTERERAFGAMIMYESSRLMFASNKTKLALVAMVDRGALTPNEWRATLNLAPVEGGDVPLRRLDTAPVKDEEPDEDPDDKGGEEDDQR